MKAEHIYVSTNSSRNDIHAFGTLYRFSSIRANALKNNDMADCRTGMPRENEEAASERSAHGWVPAGM